tara:strand:- start:813 stop:1721 length:909 start_codon:yes stop_codon:yes gene_type:complete
MDVLHELFPHHSICQIEAALHQSNGRLDDAASILSERERESLEDINQEPSIANVNLPADCFTVSLFNKASASHRTKIWHETDCIPNFKTPCFRALTDGNCGPHALGIMLSFLTDSMPSKLTEHKYVAKEIREYVSDYLFLNWTNTSNIAKEPWHEIVYISHNLAITDEERQMFPDWGMDPEERKQNWIKERDDHFYTQSDFVCFNEAMQHHGISVIFRIWRQQRTRLTHLATIPEDALSSRKQIVFDFKHTGKNDSVNAHWQLLKSGSALPTSGKKRTATVDYSGMDEPIDTPKATGKKKKK